MVGGTRKRTISHVVEEGEEIVVAALDGRKGMDRIPPPPNRRRGFGGRREEKRVKRVCGLRLRGGSIRVNRMV